MSLEKKFFFDTADQDYIKNCWESLSKEFTGKEVVGITTNPNALDKVHIDSMKGMEREIPKLCELVTNIRQDDKGIVYVQIPYSLMDTKQVRKFAEWAKTLTDGRTKIGLKIPPFEGILRGAKELSELMELNVTGIADCSTALLALSYDVRYVSIIPGRMEERGIDAKSQIQYVLLRKPNDDKDIIAGSMRTLEGLKWVIEAGTVPTIGSRVFDLILADKEKGLLNFKDMWSFPSYRYMKLSPLVTQEMKTLSEEFFTQMDSLGEEVYNEFYFKINRQEHTIKNSHE